MDPMQQMGGMPQNGAQPDMQALIAALMAQQQGGGPGMPPGMVQGGAPGMPPGMPQLPIMGAGARGGLPQPAQPVRPPMQGMPY